MKLMVKIAKIKKMNGWIMLNKLFYVLLFHMLDIVKLWKKLLDFQWKIVEAHLV